MTVISLFGDHPLASQFEALHPEDVLDAVETPERRCTGRFLVLNSYENRVYQLELEDESYIVGKFYRPGRWSPEARAPAQQFFAAADQRWPPGNILQRRHSPPSAR